MPIIKKTDKTVPALDIKKISMKGMTIKEGKIKTSRGKSSVTVDKTTYDLSLNPFIDKELLAKFPDGLIPVLTQKDNIIAIGHPEHHFPHCYILCYIPRPELFNRIDREFREFLVDKYVQEKIIPAEFEKVFKNSVH